LIQAARAQGAELRIIVVTDGDNNPWPQRVLERRWRIDATARARWGSRRRAEAQEALRCLGVHPDEISFWGYPDQGLTGLLLAHPQELSARIEEEINRWRPTLLVAPSLRDLHPDHSALGILVHFLLAGNAGGREAGFCRLDYVVHPHEPKRSSADVTVRLSPEQVARKRLAIGCHRTQVALSGRRFHRYARSEEIFEISRAPIALEPDHSVRSADYSGGVLRLRLRRFTSPATILLLANTATSRLGLSIKLTFAGEMTVQDEMSGECQGRVRRIPGREDDEFLVFAPLFSAVETLAVKVRSSLTLYDRSGWQLLPLHSRAAVTPAIASLTPSSAGVCAIVPCYNVAGVCGSVIQATADFADQVIAINDGSTDETSRVLHEIAKACGEKVKVVDFSSNRGKGCALLEGFRQALSTAGMEVVVTLDGDGQHRPEDIPRLVQPVRDTGCALAIGERLAREKMPLRSRLGNTLTAGLIQLLYPAAPVDTQSGFRSFRRDFVREIVGTIEGGRYETELEVLLLALRQNRRFGSAVIPTVYLDGNRLSHFRPLADSWRIYRTLIQQQFKSLLRERAKGQFAVNR
jgi:LmbE family N-acetylglucosaminyl deacetylase